MEEVGQAAPYVNEVLRGAGQQIVGGLSAAIPHRQRSIDHKRRAELLKAVQEISQIFQLYNITNDERCLVGQLCQTLLQFRN